MSLTQTIKNLTYQLFPTGRAFWSKIDSDRDKLISGLNASEVRAYSDALSLLDSALPDNANFTAQDATMWERRLGLISNPLVSLSDRKLAIQRKMNHPGTVKARENYRYIEAQLQAAGFDVYVYENRFPDGFGGYVTKSPSVFSLLPFPLGGVQHGDFQHGDAQHGGGFFGNKVANHIEETLDNSFYVGLNFKSTFFIGGNIAGSWATIDANRKDEFRQLVLKIKPTQTIAFLLINFY
jgi:hypothetical protein